MTAAALLREAAQAGVTVRLAEGKPKVSGSPTPDLLARLRDHKATIVAILQGDACRWCGDPLDWPRPVGVVEGTGTSLHHACYEESEVARILAAAERAVSSADPPPACIDVNDARPQRAWAS